MWYQAALLISAVGMWRRQWHPTPVLLPGKSHGQRSLVGFSPWGREESDTTEGLHLHFSLSSTGEGSGNPLQCSCLENPRDGGAWRAAVYGVAQSRTRLKWLSSTSSNWYVPFWNPPCSVLIIVPLASVPLLGLLSSQSMAPTPSTHGSYNPRAAPLTTPPAATALPKQRAAHTRAPTERLALCPGSTVPSLTGHLLS